MARRDATEQELREVWQKVSERWNDLSGKLDYPWIEASSKQETFRVTLKQMGLKVPSGMGGT